MPCSAVTLSLATITAIVATALLAIAFSTDNWVYYEVRRNQIQNAVTQRSQTSVLEQMKQLFLFYKNEGSFRICYPRTGHQQLKPI
ncbi:unnamed protein product [Macrosiphum euphorbiae]|uniref:Col_cuticle_N domain-containing protein n=1 Tax=Macrosiphum euphorbiae TaxID=13131 RepID=A0AAV0VQ91_9HEMI|nr:unnamed protein product [Macrosiphum euphorbiae]